MAEVLPASTGKPTLRVGGAWLHSRYDPEREAARFAERAVRRELPATILVLGAGMGYLLEALHRRFPAARLLAVFYDAAVAERCFARHITAAHWHPGRGRELPAFLRETLRDLDVEGLEVVEWGPAARIFPSAAAEAGKAAAQLLMELRGTLVTMHAAARRWLYNTFINYVALDAVVSTASVPRGLPVVVAASGPSLADSVELLQRRRRGFQLWSLPSALPFLLENDLSPDLVVLTDPSHYAASHLHPASGRAPLIAMPPSAARGVWRLGARVLYLDQETPYEQAVLKAAGLAAPRVPPHGTVAASAVQLALQLTEAPVVLVGLDLCFRDIRSHVRPNVFELFLEPARSRLRPLHHLLFSTAAEAASSLRGGQRTTDALRTYAGWFASLPASSGGRLFRLNPSPVELAGLAPITAAGFSELAGSDAASQTLAPRPVPGYPDRRQRRVSALAVLERWIATVERTARQASASGRLDALLEDQPSLELAYHLDPLALLETRRLLRSDGEAAAVRRAEELLAAQRGCLEELRRRIQEA